MERLLSGHRYLERFQILDANGPVASDVAGVDWADWDRAGRLIILRDGTVCAAAVSAAGIGALTTLIDSAADAPVSRESPLRAQRW
jgi:hypothetical protein